MQQDLEIQRFLNDYFKKTDYQVAKLVGDGSNREVFRIFWRSETFILVYSNNCTENLRFLCLSKALKNKKIAVPIIYAINKENTLYLQEDLGKQNFAEVLKTNQLSEDQILQTYLEIIHSLEKIHRQKNVLKECNISIKHSKIFIEHINYFQKYFLNYYDKSKKYLKTIQSELLLLLEFLKDYCQHRKLGIITRDFQARNIFIYQKNPYIIDYQDICEGHIFYDLASLIFASSSGLNTTVRSKLFLELIQNYFSKEKNFLAFFYFVLLRRLRSLGSYAKLGVLEKKANFQNQFSKTFQELLAIHQEYKVYEKFPKIIEMIAGFSKKAIFL